MRFKDAAFEILKKAGKPLHYAEITDAALASGILDTSGKTPHASMGALLYTDTLDANSRFRRGDEKGTFALKVAIPAGIQVQIDNIQAQVRKDLRRHLHKMPPQKFEELIRQLLVQMGFEETETTSYSNDKGVDVRGVLKTNPLSTVKIAIQAKRWAKNVGSDVVRDLRGSLKVADSEQGLIITPSDFTADAKSESQSIGKTPITLINGEELVDLLIKHQVGVIPQHYVVPSIDSEFWSEILGVNFSEVETDFPEVSGQDSKAADVQFPLPIQGKHHNQIFVAELLNIAGNIRMNGQEYATPSTAAKIVVTDWKEINGWDFWRYLDPNSEKWEKIGKLR